MRTNLQEFSGESIFRLVGINWQPVSQGIGGLGDLSEDLYETGPDLRPMKRLERELGERCLGGLVLYRGPEIYEIEPGFWAVPTYRFFGG